MGGYKYEVSELLSSSGKVSVKDPLHLEVESIVAEAEMFFSATESFSFDIASTTEVNWQQVEQDIVALNEMKGSGADRELIHERASEMLMARAKEVNSDIQVMNLTASEAEQLPGRTMRFGATSTRFVQVVWTGEGHLRLDNPDEVKQLKKVDRVTGKYYPFLTARHNAIVIHDLTRMDGE